VPWPFFIENHNQKQEKAFIANDKSILFLLKENVIPAKAGIYLTVFIFMAWIPAFAGMTEKGKMENCFCNQNNRS
jgi:hypothetical protein